MVEGEETGWLAVLEKKGLLQAADILDKYGINSETDVSVLDRDDFCKLVSAGLKPLQAKKLERWCDDVRPRVEHTLPSSLNNPGGAALLSSESLNLLTLPAHSATVAAPVSDNDSEGDEEEDEDDSDKKKKKISWLLERMSESGFPDASGREEG